MKEQQKPEIKYTFLFKGEYQAGNFWYLFDDGKSEYRNNLFSMRPGRTQLDPLIDIGIPQGNPDEFLLSKVASGYYGIYPKDVRLDYKFEHFCNRYSSQKITLVGIIHPDVHSRLLKDFDGYIVSEEDMAVLEVENALTDLPIESNHKKLVMCFLFDAKKNVLHNNIRSQRTINYDSLKSILKVP